MNRRDHLKAMAGCLLMPWSLLDSKHKKPYQPSSVCMRGEYVSARRHDVIAWWAMRTGHDYVLVDRELSPYMQSDCGWMTETELLIKRNDQTIYIRHHKDKTWYPFLSLDKPTRFLNYNICHCHAWRSHGNIPFIRNRWVNLNDKHHWPGRKPNEYA